MTPAERKIAVRKWCEEAWDTPVASSPFTLPDYRNFRKELRGYFRSMKTHAEKIAAYKAKQQEPRKTVVRETVFTKWPQNDRSEQLDIFPDGTMTLNGQRILKRELPAWAKKYVG